MGKRYYWLKLKNDFFTDKKIKKLRKIAGGDTYTIIYLKMMLMVLQTDGIYEYEGVEGTLAEELALELDEDEDNVEITLNYLMTANLIEEIDLNKFMLPQAIECMGSESAGAQRVRDYRDRQKTLQCNTDVTEVKHLCNVEKEKEKEKREDKDIYTPAPYSEIVDYLNEKCGTAYRSKSKKTQDCIKARLNEGFTVDDFKKVIDNKVAEWLHDEKMCKFLRPETLFGNKFEGYLNQKTVKGKIEIDNDFRDKFLKDNDPVKWGI